MKKLCSAIGVCFIALTLWGCTPRVEVLNNPENPAPNNRAEIKFSGEVDQASVLESVEAFNAQKEPKGYFAWKDETTLEYYLENPDDIRSFSVIFQKAIQDKLGREIETPTKVDFFPSEKNTKVVFQSPLNGDENISGKAPITLMWANPVFNLQNPADTKTLLDKHITITPPHQGAWQMLGSSGLLFEPKEDWKASTQYQIAVSNELGAQGVNFNFTTPRLKITGTNASDLIGKKAVRINFNQEVDLTKIRNHLSLSPNLAFDLSYGQDTSWEDEKEIKKENKKSIQLTPRDPWSADTNYTIYLPKGAYSLSGPLESEDQKQNFRTIRQFKVERFNPPYNVFGSASVNFSHPVKASDLWDHLSISPGLEDELWKQYIKDLNLPENHQSSWYNFPPLENQEWDAGKKYTLSLDGSLPDIYDRTLETDYQNTFSTTYPNRVWPFFFPASGSVIDKSSDLRLSFKYSGNVSYVDIEFKKIFPQSQTWNYSTALDISPEKVSFWELDLLTTFPEILDQENQIQSGKYEITFNFNIDGQNYPSRWNTQFYASDFGVLMKSFANDQAEFSLLDFEGTPLTKGGTITGYNYQGEQISSDQTDTFPFIKKETTATDYLIKVGDQIGIGSQNFQRKINPYDARISFSPWEYNQTHKAVLTTDRPLFKPGQKVHLKSIFREKERFGKKFPLKSSQGLNANYRIEIQNPFWKTIGEFSGKSLDGSLDEVFEIPADSPLGEYRATLYIDGNNIATSSFHIQKFRKPKFLIQSEFDTPYAVEGETVTAKIGAQYAFGGALKGKRIRYHASLFGQEACTFWDWWCPQRDKVLQSGEGVLDHEGRFELPFKLDIEEDETAINWTLLNLTVTIYESPDEVSSQTISIPFASSNHKISLDHGPYFYYPGDEAKVSGKITDLEDQPLKKQKITLSLYQTKWVRNDRKGADGTFYGEWEKEENQISSQPIKSNESGVFEITVVLPEEGGDYFFRVENQDEKDRTTSAQRSFWIAGKKMDSIHLNDENKLLQIFSDKDTYEIGETVEVFFPLTNFEVNYARATIERGDIIEEIDVKLNKNIVQFKTENWMAPNVFVSLFLQGKNAEGQNDIRWGAVEIPVKDPSKKLDINLSFDKETYRPGEEVSLNIETSIKEKGESAEVTIAVVDQTLLALKSRPPLNIWQYFLAKVPLGVTTSHTLDQFMSKAKMDEILDQAKNVAAESADMFGGGGGKVDDDKPRGDFRDTAVFFAKIKTDEEGKATQTFKLPDNLTTWNIWAIGHTSNNAFGEQESEVKATLPLLISEIVPNFFHLGDRVKVGLLIRRNNPDIESENVTVKLQAPTFFQTAETEKTIEVKEEARVFFDLDIPVSAELLNIEDQVINLGFKVESESGEKDAITLKRNLTMPLSQLTAAESLSVGTEDNNTPSINILPNTSESLLSKIIISVYNSLANKLGPLIEEIDDKNYGCTEQRFSYVTSLLLQDQFNRSLERESLELEKAEIQEHLDYIHESFLGNGFGFWKQSRQPNIWLTAHILEYAPLWEQYGFAFDKEKLQTGAKYLLTEATKECDREINWWCISDSTRQHAFYVVTKYDLDVDLDFATKHTSDIESKIWWIKTYHLKKDKGQLPSPLSDDQYAAFWKDIESKVNFRDRYAFWARGNSFYAQDERLTALVYSELHNHPNLKAFKPKVARYLSESNIKKLSTNSALYLLQVLGQLAKEETQNKGVEFQVQSTQGESKAEVIHEGTLAGLDATLTKETIIPQDHTGTLQLDFMAINDKAYYSDIELKEIFPSSKVKGLSKGFWVEKEIYEVNDDEYENPVTDLKLGDTYRVRLRVITNTHHRQVRVADFIPSGAEILNFAFDNVDQNIQQKPNEPWYCRGWCTPNYDHHEFHEDRAEFFMDFLGSGTHQVEYFIRTRLPGTFEVKPTHVEEMYFPEVFGTSDGMKVEIK